jgi:NAD(P)-dependent dehydrogenase (short-subunit alcohol dehydrogenase family)
MGTFDRKVALVTGAGQGIGRGIALALAREGAAVALVGRTDTKLEGVASEIADRGGHALPIVGDVSDGEQVDHAVKQTVAELGTIDVLVNNAQEYTFGALLEVDLDDVEAGWSSGALATLRFMRAAHPHLSRGGAIVNVSSSAATDASPAGVGVYAAVKAAIQVLTRTAAVEWAADGIRVNAIVPFSKSPSVEAVLSHMPGAEEHVLSQVPLGRWGDAETEIGRAVAFLCGPDAAFVTGVVLPIDGGSTYLR